ncbi:hypothetical protein [Yersinia sp. Marseille-Q3913]|uniref:hypothetical protein n=1 Tax=Yersinia sp. Marseille-Q3913 TaxID=2830769 RepID=UPI001BB01937|nr:hypothetical protein [Yersinia sp. Marseille-Q3913]MBS0057737.1 hypothetical protein [Yersinia sp. Marseille-Q3913]
MNTQTSRPPLPESTERYVKIKNNNGFIKSIRIPHPTDTSSAVAVLKSFIDQAIKSSGQHYEIYETRLLRYAMTYYRQLPLFKQTSFFNEALKFGIILTLATLEALEAAESNGWENKYKGDCPKCGKEADFRSYERNDGGCLNSYLAVKCEYCSYRRDSGDI